MKKVIALALSCLFILSGVITYADELEAVEAFYCREELMLNGTNHEFSVLFYEDNVYISLEELLLALNVNAFYDGEVFSLNSHLVSQDIDTRNLSRQREPLPKTLVNETEYYTDELDWISDTTKLTAGMKTFYQKTGVQPYLYITDTINGSHYPNNQDAEVFARSKYDELFSDEAHMLLIFFEYEPNIYYRWGLCGNQAKTVLDNEAMDIIYDYIDRYYTENMSDEEYFSKAFDEASKRIMGDVNIDKADGWSEIITFDDLEMSFGSNITFVVYENQYSEYNGATTIKIPVRIKNIKNETHYLNFMYYDFFNPKGTQTKDFCGYFDDSIEHSGKLRSGAEMETYFYIEYSSDGNYVIEFDDWLSEKAEIEIYVEK